MCLLNNIQRLDKFEVVKRTFKYSCLFTDDKVREKNKMLQVRIKVYLATIVIRLL
jgi:hypothetical protein